MNFIFFSLTSFTFFYKIITALIKTLHKSELDNKTTI